MQLPRAGVAAPGPRAAHGCRADTSLIYHPQRFLQVYGPLIEIFAYPYLPGEISKSAGAALGNESRDPNDRLPHAGDDELFAVSGSHPQADFKSVFPALGRAFAL